MSFNVKLTKNDKSAVPEDVNLECVNNLLDSLFSKKEVYFNGQCVENNSAHQPYKLYFR